MRETATRTTSEAARGDHLNLIDEYDDGCDDVEDDDYVSDDVSDDYDDGSDDVEDFFVNFIRYEGCITVGGVYKTRTAQHRRSMT